uniref:Putative ovule protein n=1 Tax=Solanum chacoense TaxID=4108 RepID=A0A0V0HAH0_SOLCH
MGSLIEEVPFDFSLYRSSRFSSVSSLQSLSSSWSLSLRVSFSLIRSQSASALISLVLESSALKSLDNSAFK